MCCRNWSRWRKKSLRLINLSILTGENINEGKAHLGAVQALPWPHLAGKCPPSISPAAQQGPEECIWPAAVCTTWKGMQS